MKNLFKKNFQICWTRIIGTFLANVAKMAFPEGREINKKKFISVNPVKNKLSVHMRSRKFFQAFASAYRKI